MIDRVTVWWSAMACLGVVAAGCVEPSSIRCDEFTCPTSWVCRPAGDGCLPADALTSCAGAADGDACTAGDLSGACAAGICEVVVCGNGRVDFGEACDDGNVVGGDGCDTTCRSTERCGNGIVDHGEGCDCGDSADTQNARCSSLNSLDGFAECRPDCTPHACGDGVLEGSEACESGHALTKTCADFGFYSGSLACNGICQFDAIGCSDYCGDGVINGFAGGALELCDGAPPLKSCLGFGFDAGRIGCSSICAPAFAGCRLIGYEEIHDAELTYPYLWASAADDVWAVATFQGSALHWDGSTWTEHTIPGLTYARAVWGSGKNDVYVVGNTTIAHFDGSTWTTTTAPSNVNAISGSGPDFVVATGDDGMIYVWNGSTWETQASGVTEDIYGVSAISPSKAFAVVPPAGSVPLKILELSQGTWTPISGAPRGQFDNVLAFAADDIYLAGYALVHWDGADWSTIQLGIDNTSLRVFGSGPDDVYVAYGTRFAHFDGAAWGFDADPLGVYGGFALSSSVAFASTLSNGTIARYGGTRYLAATPSATHTRITATGIASNGELLAVGTRGTALRFDGTGWAAVPGELDADFTAVSRSFAVGSQGAFASYDGTRMRTLPSGTRQNLRGVWAADDTHAWAITPDSVIAWNGTTAAATTLGALLGAIWGFSATDIYVIGSAGMFKHWNGTTWTALAAWPGFLEPIGMWGTAGTDLWVIDAVSVWHWNGTAWADATPVLAGVQVRPKSIFGVGQDAYIPIGDSNVLVRKAATSSWQVSTACAATTGGTFHDGQLVWLASDTVFRTPFGLCQRELPDFSDGSYSPGLYAAAKNDIYMVRSRDLLRFDGTLWSRVSTGFRDHGIVQGSASNNVFVSGGPMAGGNAVRRWNGSSWQSLGSACSNGSVTHLQVLSPTDAWAACSYTAGLSRYNGTSWIAFDTAGHQIGETLLVRSPTDIWATDQNNALIHYDGVTWTTVTVPGGATGMIYALWASGSHVFVVATKVHELDTSTNTWRQHTASVPLYHITGTSPTDVFATSVEQLQHFDGEVWSQVRADGVIEAMTMVGDQLVLGTQAPLRLSRDIPW